MTTQDILELAARCEAATGPDRELDGLIEVARDPMRETILYTEPGPFPQKAVRGPVRELALSGADLADYISAPRYTASLDAAMTLVPEGLGVGWRITDGVGGPTAEVWSANLDSGQEAYHVAANPTATPALALTAAALKARAHTKGEE